MDRQQIAIKLCPSLVVVARIVEERLLLRLRDLIRELLAKIETTRIVINVFCLKIHNNYINGGQKSDPPTGSVPAAAAPAGPFPARTAAPGCAAVRSCRRLSVRHDVWWRRSRRGRCVRAAALRTAAAPPGHPCAQPAVAYVQSGGGHVRGGGGLPRLHRLPRAVLPLLPHGAALHPAPQTHHHDTEWFRGRRAVRGLGADAAAARPARRAALARASRRPAAPSSAVALN